LALDESEVKDAGKIVNRKNVNNSNQSAFFALNLVANTND
jgi:hypothetical protein